jgi:hypothetical protein
MLASSLSTRDRSASLFWQFLTSLMNVDSPRIPETAIPEAPHSSCSCSCCPALSRRLSYEQRPSQASQKRDLSSDSALHCKSEQLQRWVMETATIPAVWSFWRSSVAARSLRACLDTGPRPTGTGPAMVLSGYR